MKSHDDNYLVSKVYDYIFFVSPGFLSVLIVIDGHVFSIPFEKSPLVTWVILVLFIDVAHVYATLYRVYFFPGEFKRRRLLYLVLPLVVYVTGVYLYWVSGLLFWRVLAYLAVFHFIRQQYGFIVLYHKRNREPYWQGVVAKIAVYTSTLYPIYYWHTHLPRRFNWFIDNDFIEGLPEPDNWVFYLYLTIAAGYVLSSIVGYIQSKKLNLPKDLFMLATWLNWYLGIIYFNSDFAFTVTNVTTHGICYMALVYATARKNQPPALTASYRFYRFFTARAVPFVALLFFLAYTEEYLWHNLVWLEKTELFGSLGNGIPGSFLIFIVPLLMLPQGTHYFLDGFIWRFKKNPQLQAAFSKNNPGNLEATSSYPQGL